MALHNVRHGPQIDDPRRRKPKKKPQQTYSDFLSKQRNTKQTSRSLADASSDSSEEEVRVKKKPKQPRQPVKEVEEEEDGAEDYGDEPLEDRSSSDKKGKTLESELADELQELDPDVQDQIKRDGQKLLRWAMNGKDDKHMAKRVLFND